MVKLGKPKRMFYLVWIPCGSCEYEYQGYRAEEEKDKPGFCPRCMYGSIMIRPKEIIK